jgi:hypothetical protein
MNRIYNSPYKSPLKMTMGGFDKRGVRYVDVPGIGRVWSRCNGPSKVVSDDGVVRSLQVDESLVIALQQAIVCEPEKIGEWLRQEKDRSEKPLNDVNAEYKAIVATLDRKEREEGLTREERIELQARICRGGAIHERYNAALEKSTDVKKLLNKLRSKRAF